MYVHKWSNGFFLAENVQFEQERFWQFFRIFCECRYFKEVEEASAAFEDSPKNVNFFQVLINE
jgi:hypothetical protein